jgi:ElaB/YqjD/DUF883 family membrane-anchored ribosome-binding protein
MPATLLEKQPSLEDVLNEVSRIKTVITEAVDDGVRSALRAVKQGRHAAEDAVEDAKHAVKKNPLKAIGVIFAAGFLTGGLAFWIGMRRR